MSDVMIAPFSNSDIRDWPLQRFSDLLGLLVQRLPPGLPIRVIGAPGQRLRACEVVRAHPSDRVSNDCGRLAWAEVLQRLQRAACVVSNNSGIGHLGGMYGVPTVCIFGGSHPRREWRPLGRSVVLVSRAIGCSPCQRDHSTGSPYLKACLREVTAEAVADAVAKAMAGGRAPSRLPGSVPAPARGEGDA